VVAFGVDPDAGALLALVVALVAGGIAVRRLFPAVVLEPSPRETKPLRLAAALAGLVLLVAGLASALAVAARSRADANWDVWAFWLGKAKAIYYFHGLDTAAGGYTSFPNADYPPLVPSVDAATFHLMGGVHASLLPLQQCLLGIAFAGALVVLLLPYVPRWILFPSLALLVLSPSFWDRITTVLPDQSVAYFLAAAAVGCVLWIEERRPAWLALSTLFLAAATLTKNEGLFLGGLLVVAMLVASVAVHRRPGLLAAVLVLGLAAILPWKLWLARHGQPTSAGDYSWSELLHPGFLADRLHRLGYASRHMAHFVLDTGSWLLVLPLVLVALVLAARARPAVAIALAAWLVAGFAGLATVYWIGRPELHWYVETSAQRVVATLPLVSGAVLPLLLGLALGSDHVEQPLAGHSAQPASETRTRS
jgi:hypothetical protein